MDLFKGDAILYLMIREDQNADMLMTVKSLQTKVAKLERENAALREAGHLAEKIIVQRTDEIRHLERENAELRDLAAFRAAYIEHNREYSVLREIVIYNDEDQKRWDNRLSRALAQDRIAITSVAS